MSLHPSVVHSGRHQRSLRRVVHRGTYWYGTVSVHFDHHALSRSPASIASADPGHLGRLVDQCQLDIPYQAHVHHQLAVSPVALRHALSDNDERRTLFKGVTATCTAGDSNGRCAAWCTYWYGTVSVRFDHHSLSRSPASIASADPARAGSLRVTRAGRGDTAPWRRHFMRFEQHDGDILSR